MKQKSLVTIITILFLTNAFAQVKQYSPSTLKKVNAIKANSSFSWYKNFITNRQTFIPINSGSNETIIKERSNPQGMKVQVGINLASNGAQFTNNGNSRSEEVGNNTCVYQPKKINYLIPEDIGVSFLSDFNYYPGDFIKPNDIINSGVNLNPYNANAAYVRNPYKIGINIFSNSNSNEITVTDFNTIPVNKIQDSLLMGNYGARIPTSGILEALEITSDIQLATTMEMSQGAFLPLEELGLPLDITAGLRTSSADASELNLKYFMVSFNQPMYSLTLNTRPNALFANPTHSNLNPNGAYISDVTYGRRAFFIFASANYSRVMNAMFEGGIDAEVTGGQASGVQVGVKANGTIDASIKASVKKFYGAIYGGSGNTVLSKFNDIDAFFTSFKEYIASTQATTFNRDTRAKPLSYSLRRISDGALIGIRSIGNFDEVDCNTNSYEVTLNFKGFTVNKVDDGPFDDKDDLFGNLHYDGYRNSSTNTSAGSYQLFVVPESAPISKGINQSYIAAQAPNKVISKISKSDLLTTILNFSETIKDDELVMNFDYNPLNPINLQFQFSSIAPSINNLAIGATYKKIFQIQLYEGGESNKAKATFDIEVIVKRN